MPIYEYQIGVSHCSGKDEPGEREDRNRPYLFQLSYSDAHGNGQQQVVGCEIWIDLLQH